MKSGTSAVNIADMAEVNFEYLYEVNPLQTGTPTVYDLKKDDTVDIYDDNGCRRSCRVPECPAVVR